MTRLNEDDFLEKLMPYLHRGSGAVGDCCPNSESLVAFGDGTLDVGETERIRHHVARCSACTEIQARLLRFESDVQPPLLEYRNAEKRLSNWIDSLLNKQSPSSQVIHTAGPWEKLWRLAALPRVHYRVAGAVIALFVGATLTITTTQRLRSHRLATAPAVSNGTAGAAGTLPVTQERLEHLDASRASQSLIEPHSAVLEGGKSEQYWAFDPEKGEIVFPLVASQSIVRIEPRTQVLVRIAFAKQQVDGSLSFQGILLKPLPDGRGKELFPWVVC